MNTPTQAQSSRTGQSLGRDVLFVLLVFAVVGVADNLGSTGLRILLHSTRGEAADRVPLVVDWLSGLVFLIAPWLESVIRRRRAVVVLQVVCAVTLLGAAVAAFGGKVAATTAGTAVTAIVGAVLALFAWGALVTRCDEKRRAGLLIAVRGAQALAGVLVTKMVARAADVTGAGGESGSIAAFGIPFVMVAALAGLAAALTGRVFPPDLPSQRDARPASARDVLRDLWTSAGTRAALFISVLLALALSQAEQTLTMFAMSVEPQGGLGWTTEQLGTAIGVARNSGSVIGLAGVLILVHRSGSERWLRPFALAGLAGMVLMLLIYAWRPGTTPTGALLFVVGLLTTVATVGVQLFAMNAASRGRFGLAQFALIVGTSGLAATFGTFTLPFALGGLGFVGAGVVPVLVVALAVVVAFRVPRSQPEPRAGGQTA